jgi:hypothetical protein
MQLRNFALAAALTSLSFQPVTAQNTSGLQLGVYLNGTSLSVQEEDDLESGGGIAARIGYGLPNGLSVFLGGTTARMDPGDYTLVHYDMGARYQFRNRARLRPYLEAAVSGNSVRFDFLGETIQMRGIGPTGGAGLEYGIGHSLALEAGLAYTFGRYTQARLSGERWEALDEDSFRTEAARFNLGIVWRP